MLTLVWTMLVSVLKGGVSTQPETSPQLPLGSGKSLCRGFAGRAGNASLTCLSRQACPLCCQPERNQRLLKVWGWGRGLCFFTQTPLRTPGTNLDNSLAGTAESLFLITGSSDGLSRECLSTSCVLTGGRGERPRSL